MVGEEAGGVANLPKPMPAELGPARPRAPQGVQGLAPVLPGPGIPIPAKEAFVPRPSSNFHTFSLRETVRLWPGWWR